jgi:hypothetical protein
MKLTTHSHPVPRLQCVEIYFPVPTRRSGAEFKHGDNFQLAVTETESTILSNKAAMPILILNLNVSLVYSNSKVSNMTLYCPFTAVAQSVY